ncbi:MAG: hypothetical protein WC728_16580 [Elusimicrobiota bacterium]
MPEGIPWRFLRWGVLLERKLPALFLACCGAAFLSYLAAWVPSAFENWSRQASVRETAEDAATYGITCEAAAAKPWDAVGRPVRWRLLHPTRGAWSCNTGQSVAWTGPEPDLPFTGQSGAMNSVAIVATVVDVKAGKLILSYQGKG